jgi:hypothetical protein
LVPAQDDKHPDNVAAVADMLSFMRTRKPVGNVDLRALIDEGRA